MSTNDEIKAIYLASPSLRQAALRLGLPLHKIRSIRDALGWPKLKPSYDKINIVRLPPRKQNRSIYDSVLTDTPLSGAEIERFSGE